MFNKFNFLRKLFTRYEILKKNLAKETIEKKTLVEKEMNENQARLDKDIELAFLNQEQEAIEKEHADQMVTKRIIDKMMTATPDEFINEVCVLLSNYKGSF